MKKLEADVALPAHSFENGGAIDTLVLDKNVVSISYDWEGHSSSVSNRTVYVKNENMLIQYYGNGGTYYSPLGSSGDVIVYVPATSSVDLGESVNPSGDGILTLNGYTSYAHSGNYTNYIKGTTSSVTIRAKQNIDTQMEEDGVTSLKNTEVDKEQTGIDAYYTSIIPTLGLNIILRETMTFKSCRTESGVYTIAKTNSKIVISFQIESFVSSFIEKFVYKTFFFIL